MNTENFILVRSPNLIEKNQIGYGWKKVNFSAFHTFRELMNEGFKGLDVGRTTNQSRRFYNLKKGDFVVVPFSGAIAIAEVIGEKSFHPNEKGIRYGENRISVRYLRHDNGVFIPRKNLSTALQNRLKIRMTICDLNEFSEELGKHIESFKNNALYAWDTEQEIKQKNLIEKFKSELLLRLRKNKEIYLKSGGVGLENLVKEILEAKGYTARIPAKNEKSGIQDVDIIATRFSEFSEKREGLFIQVKHHSGITSTHGIKQVAEYEINENDFSQIDRVLITTADFNKIDFADVNEVTVLAGIDFVDWLYGNLDLLSEESLVSLGISNLPTLL